MSAAPPFTDPDVTATPSTDPGAALGHIYAEYYGLSESPFAITPDPRFLFMSQRHRDALAHLLFAVKQGGGFVQLTGEVGTGKTTLTRALLAQLPPNVSAAIVLNPKQTAHEFVQSICDELGVPRAGDTSSIKALTDALNAHLLDAHTRGQRTLVLIDEAQNLDVGVLEQIRLLTNLETTKEKLLQIILVGQPELRLMLDRKDLRQLAQRITARYHLLPLSERETAEMVKHRLAVAGFTQHLFSDPALRLIHRAARGVPRIINVICDRALLGAYAENQRVIDRRVVLRATAEVLGEDTARQVSARSRWVAATIGVVLIGSAVALGVRWMSDRSVPAALPAATAPAPGTEPAPTTAGTPSAAPVVDPATAQPPAAPENFSDAMNTPGVQADLSQGMTTLLALWSRDYRSARGITPCDRAAALQLACFTGNATLPQLKAMNHPAILKLETANGSEVHAVLARINGAELELRFDGRSYPASASDLHPFWHGEYLLLWDRPQIGTSLIAPGIQGVPVRWLNTVLSRVEGVAEPTETALLFDAALTGRVKAFQRRINLPADGIVGEQTMIPLLGALAEPGAPRLIPPGS
jgi:general secretion pathway protein A